MISLKNKNEFKKEFKTKEKRHRKFIENNRKIIIREMSDFKDNHKHFNDKWESIRKK